MGTMRTIEDRISNAVKERYITIPTLKLCLWEDEDTVLVNISDDLNYEVEEDKILITIKKLINENN